MWAQIYVTIRHKLKPWPIVFNIFTKTFPFSLLHSVWFSRTFSFSLLHKVSDEIYVMKCPGWSHNHMCLTHWGRVTHICVSKQTNIGSDNGLSPGRRLAIIWTNAGILLIGPLGTNFSEISIEIHILSFKKMHLKISSAKWRPFCLGLNVLTHFCLVMPYAHRSGSTLISSDNGLFPDGTKPLPDSVLTYR